MTMKKTLRLCVLAFLALLAISSCQKSISYTITGEVKDQRVKQIYLVTDLDQGIPFDTVKVEGGKFAYNGQIDSVSVCFVGNLNDSIMMMPIILEEGNINIVLSRIPTESHVGGTALNDEFQKINEAAYKFQADMEAVKAYADSIDSISTPSDSQREEIERRAMETMTGFANMYYKCAEKNIGNELGFLLVVSNLNGGFLNEEQTMTLINKMPQHIRSRGVIGEITDMIKNYEKEVSEAEAAPLPDFSAPDPDGKTISARDEVAKHELTIIDFWASWCGPCMNEMPHMVELYSLYRDKGLGILGVSLDTDGEAWRNAIKQSGATWPQMSELSKDSKIARMFDVKAIPFTMIVDTEGNVVASGLRGTELEDFIHNALAE